MPGNSVDGPGAQATEVRHHRLRRFLDLQGNAVAGLQAARNEQIGDPTRHGKCIAVGSATLLWQRDEYPIAHSGTALDQREQVVGHVFTRLATFLSTRAR